MKKLFSKASLYNSPIIAAAFLMATSAIGPGFLTQTAVFTNSLLASFGFVILISIEVYETTFYELFFLTFSDPLFETRCSIDMASVYILLNLGSAEALRWTVDLPKSARYY